MPPSSSLTDARDYQTSGIFGGRGGLWLGAVEQAPENDWTRLTNVWRLPQGGWTSRVGETAVTNVIGTLHHSIARLNNPQAGTWTRIWGIDTSLYFGQSGALTSADTGYSGDPLTLVEARPPFSGETWMYVGDRTRNRKIRSDGTDLPLGFAAPAAPTTALDTINSKTIQTFNSTAGWVGYAGTGGVPTLGTVAGKVGNALTFTTAPGAATGAYQNYADVAIGPLDLTTFGGGIDATDDDFMHLWLKADRVDALSEIRIYLISTSFTTGYANLPGANASTNADAFVKAFRPNDITQVIETTTQFVTGGTQTVVTADQYEAAVEGDETSVTLNVGRGAWTEYGVLDIPLRRSDFLQIGAGDWANIVAMGILIKVANNTTVVVGTFDDFYIHGGRGPDTAGPSDRAYDYRVTHYDTRTGAEGNPSPIQAETLWLDALRRGIVITPAAAYGDAAVRQRIYRRGGGAATTDDWYFVATNSADGVAYTDNLADDTILTAGTVAIDNDQPVTTANASGTTVLAQPVPVFFGPVEGYLFALGDPYRPGHLYWSKRGNFDSWPATNLYEVCSPSEQLIAGAVYANQAFCWSLSRLYSIFPDQIVAGQTAALPTACRRGLLARWAFCVGPDGLYALDQLGVYRTRGDTPEDLIDEDLRPLFHGQTVNGYAPIDLTVPLAIRLAVYDNELWVSYQDTGAAQQVLILNLATRKWRHYSFARAIAALAPEQTGTGQALVLGGKTTGVSYTHSGLSDDSVAIACTMRSASRGAPTPNADLLLGDVFTVADRQSTTLTITPYLNYETSSLASVTITSGSGVARTILSPFGTTPQQARTVALDIAWSSSAQRPVLYEAGISWIRQPDTTVLRPTDWSDLGVATEKYVTGILIDCDTATASKTVVVEGTTVSGTVVTLSTLTVSSAARRVLSFGWAAVDVVLVRLRPTDTAEWQLFGVQWLTDPEPAWTTRFGTLNFSDLGWIGEKYVTGILLEGDTANVAKTLQVEIDGTVVETLSVTMNGRRTLQFGFTSGPYTASKVLRLIPTDANPGKLYAAQWLFDPEPPNTSQLGVQNWSLLAAPSDKFVKGVVIECDTGNVAKTVRVEQEGGTLISALTVQANGRQLLEFSFAQTLSRVLRLRPTDTNPGKLYSVQWLCDIEPLALARQEYQPTDYGLPSYKSPLWAEIAYRSTGAVTLTWTTTLTSGSLLTDTYTLPSTSGAKQVAYVPFVARKGVLFTALFTAAADFRVYPEESRVWLQPATGASRVLPLVPPHQLTPGAPSLGAASGAGARP